MESDDCEHKITDELYEPTSVKKVCNICQMKGIKITMTMYTTGENVMLRECKAPTTRSGKIK